MLTFLFIVSAFAAGFMIGAVVWPGLRTHAFGLSAEIATLRARAKALEDLLTGGR